MAIPKIKATYSLDVPTVRALERLAKIWGVSKSEVVRRAVRQAERSKDLMSEKAADAVAALDELEELLADRGEELEEWAKEVREIRKASSSKRLDRRSP
jgi:hypothetical protein